MQRTRPPSENRPSARPNPEPRLAEFRECFDRIVVPESGVVGYPSRFRNIWAPVPERTIWEEDVVRAQDVTVRVQHGVTGSLIDIGRATRGSRLRLAVETTLHGPTLNLGDRIAYDARLVYNGNIAHLIGAHVANLGYANQRLGLSRNEVVVIVEDHVPKLALDLFDFIGYEVVATNRRVQGNLLTVDIDELENYLLAPFVHRLEPASVRPGGVDRLFISRRSSRRIANEEQVWPILRERGFERVHFEELSLPEQWGLVRDAKEIVSVHGAALGYLPGKCGSQAGCDYRLLEVFSPGLVADIFRKITAVVGGQWYGCRGRITAEFVRVVDESSDVKAADGLDFELHPDTLRLALDHFGLGTS